MGHYNMRNAENKQIYYMKNLQNSMKKKILATTVVAVLLFGLVAMPLSLYQNADAAKIVAKKGWTRSIDVTSATSIKHDALGHESHQAVYLLPLEENRIYRGVLTYTASKSVDILVYHKIGDPAPGLPTVQIGDKVYSVSKLQTGDSGTVRFVGNALLAHTGTSDQFSVSGTLSVISRVIAPVKEVPKVSFGELKLSRQNVPVKIPMLEGWYDGGKVAFIATESSDKAHRDMIEAINGFKTVLAPQLSKAPDAATAKIYMFTNGVSAGAGIMGAQRSVFDSTPVQTNDYSPLRKIVHVTWTNPTLASQAPLKSVQEIMDRQAKDELKLEETNIVLNLPMIKWPGGQMKVREGVQNVPLNELPYGGGQILSIAENNKVVTFIAHRGWGPSGATVYYIVTDATPKGPADMMGVVYAPKTEALALSPAVADLYQFANGIKGSGPMGFQPGIAAANIMDKNYSPMWRISFIKWNDKSQARVLETLDDIQARSDSITTELAMEGKHIVNCPFLVEIPKVTSTSPAK